MRGSKQPLPAYLPQLALELGIGLGLLGLHLFAGTLVPAAPEEARRGVSIVLSASASKLRIQEFFHGGLAR